MTILPIIFFVIYYITVVSTQLDVNWENYCNPHQTHILCKYGRKQNPNCDGRNLTATRVEFITYTTIYSIFNHFRSKLANKTLTFDNDKDWGISTQMRQLKWDEFLADVAFARASDCRLNLTLQKNVALSTFTPGEMIISPNHTGYKVGQLDTFEAATEAWTENSKKLIYASDNKNGRLPFDKFVEVSEHQNDNELIYSILQIMKDDIYLIGCAKSKYTKEKNENPTDDNQNYIFVCFTGASNEATNVPVIKNTGNQVASKCDNNNKSIIYPELCYTLNENVYPYAFDKELPYITKTSSCGTKKSSWIFILSSLVFVSFFKR